MTSRTFREPQSTKYQTFISNTSNFAPNIFVIYTYNKYQTCFEEAANKFSICLCSVSL